MKETLSFDQFKQEVQQTRFVNLQPSRREYTIHQVEDPYLAPFSYDGVIYHASSDDGMVYRYYANKNKWYVYYRDMFGEGTSLAHALQSMYEYFDGVRLYSV